MRDEYDFSNAKRNPYAQQLQSTLTIVMNDDEKRYFEQLAQDMGVSYQTLIQWFLKDCVQNQRKPNIQWS